MNDYSHMVKGAMKKKIDDSWNNAREDFGQIIFEWFQELRVQGDTQSINAILDYCAKRDYR